MTRKYTNMLLEMIDDGLIDRDLVINACLKYMSEDDVQDMMEANEFIEEQYEDEDEDEDDDDYTVTGCDPDEYEYDGQPDEAQEWADFDADC